MGFATINDFLGGEAIYFTESLADAQALIPVYTFPKDPIKQELYRDTFEDGYEMSSGDLIEYSPSNSLWAIIDPDGCPFNSGKYIFDVTYTVILLCPPEKRMIIDYLIKQFIDLNTESDDNNANTLMHIWEDIISRIIFSKQTPSIDLYLLLHEIKDGFEFELNQLSNGPTQDDWRYLDEYCLK
ncbi:hypothetical protein [Marinicella gelatinilytica]|uniref:hypothetical protein n=1 Tax=Marinicella gelatinilytica TaxID=2996017 RepID=UPI002260BA0F|nr:hypothetical protein [Marinicella gelatinilytica]MCX7545346.1 hypothetical protein [Marinicella gelatinilytica]